MIAPARRAAYHALRAIADGRQDLPAALASGRSHLRDERDRALALEIVTGTLRWQRSLDHLIEQFANRALIRIEPEVLTILRLCAYQLLHLDRVPASAVVDDGVDLTREAKKPGASGFVNGLLRALLRSRNRLPLPSRPANMSRQAALDYLGITHSHPAWLVDRWLDRVGLDDAERWVRFNNAPPGLTLRVNLLRGSRDAIAAGLARQGIETRPTRYAPAGLEVVSGNPLRGATDGSFVVQEEASQLVGLVAGARPGERILDLCAAPGGKATAMAADMEDAGLLVATDVRARRMRLLQSTVHASGAKAIRMLHIGRDGPLPFRAPFDRLLVDAPCSGLGTIRRDPDIRWRRTPDDLPAFAAAQSALLDRAAPHVAEGGRLIYATCSSEPEENEDVVDAFLRRHGGFALADLRTESVFPTAVTPLFDARGLLRTRPHADGLEAFFAAVMVRLKV